MEVSKVNFSKPIYWSSPFSISLMQLDGVTSDHKYFGIRNGEEFEEFYILDASYISYCATHNPNAYDNEAIMEVLKSGGRLERVPYHITKSLAHPEEETADLVALICKLENDESIKPIVKSPEDEDYEGIDLWVPHIELRDAIESEANDCLILEGKPNYININYLSSLGIRVGPGETDSFGWLTGIIKTKKGVIVFG